MGFSDARLAKLTGLAVEEVTRRRRALDVRPVFKRIDTCAAEFASPTAYMYSTYETPFAGRQSDEAAPSDRKKVVILGGGPNRIGQGIEFDYCCCHAAFALKEVGLRNHHDQLQSGDRVDRLRHLRPALFRAAYRRGRAGDHRDRADERHAAWRDRAVRRADAAQARRVACSARRYRSSARRRTPSTSPRTATASSSSSTRSSCVSRRAALPRARARRAPPPTRSAIRS